MRMHIKYIFRALLLFGLIGVLAIACTNPSSSETASAGLSGVAVIGSTTEVGTPALNANAGGTLILEDTKITTITNYQSSMSFLGKPRGNTFSPYFTDGQVQEIAQKLGIPDKTEVSVYISEQYAWEEAEINIADVGFYQNGTYIAGAECEVNTSNLARSIYKYEKQ